MELLDGVSYLYIMQISIFYFSSDRKLISILSQEWIHKCINNIFSRSDSLVAQTLKRLPAMRETGVRPLGQENPLEEDMATHSSTLA